MKRTAALAALVVALGLAGCSKSTETSTSTTTTAAATSSTAAEKTTTTKAEDDKTTTTKKKTSSTKASPKAEKIIESQKKSAESAGVEFTDEETECMAGYIEDNPEVEQLDDPSTLAEWELVFGMISSCVDKEKFVDLSIGTMTGVSTTQKACLKDAMMELSVQQFAGLAAQDPDTLAEVGPLFAKCG